jgi:hypothetical protein
VSETLRSVVVVGSRPGATPSGLKANDMAGPTRKTKAKQKPRSEGTWPIWRHREVVATKFEGFGMGSGHLHEWKGCKTESVQIVEETQMRSRKEAHDEPHRNDAQCVCATQVKQAVPREDQQTQPVLLAGLPCGALAGRATMITRRSSWHAQPSKSKEDEQDDLSPAGFSENVANFRRGLSESLQETLEK